MKNKGSGVLRAIFTVILIGIPLLGAVYAVYSGVSVWKQGQSASMGVLPTVVLVLTLTLLIEAVAAVIYVVLRYVTGGKKKEKNKEKKARKEPSRFGTFVRKHIAATVISAVILLVILFYTVLFLIQDLPRLG